MSTATAQDNHRKYLLHPVEPLTDRTKERLGRVEDKVSASIQAEIDAVSTSLRTRAVQIRPSAIAFGVAALMTFFGLVLLAGSLVVAVAAALPLWAAFAVGGGALLLLATGAAAWGHRHLPDGPALRPIPMPTPNHPAGDLVHPWAD